LKHWKHWMVGALALAALAGCGGDDKTALARKTVQIYWQDINQGKWRQAYHMMTTGQQQATTISDYVKNWADFLTNSTGGVTAVVGQPRVDGSCAKVPITLKSPRTYSPKQYLHAYQDLYWQNGEWRISNELGALTHSAILACA